MTSKISGTVSPRISVHAQNSNAVPEEIPNAALDARCRVPTECRRNLRRQLRLHPKRIAENSRRRSSQIQAVPPNNTFNHRCGPPKLGCGCRPPNGNDCAQIPTETVGKTSKRKDKCIRV